MRARIRAWLHWRGVHAFYRERYEPSYREIIWTLGGEALDITNQSALGRVVHF